MRILFCYCTYSDALPEDTKNHVLKELCASDVAFDAVPDLCELAARHDPACARYAAGAAIAACYPRCIRWLLAWGDDGTPSDRIDVLNMGEQEAGEITQALLEKAAAGGTESLCPANGTKALEVVVCPQAGDSGVSRFELVKALLRQGYRVSCMSPGGERPAPGEATFFCDTLDRDPAAAIEEIEAFRNRIGAAKSGAWVPWFPVIDYDRCTNCKQCLNFCLFGVFGVTAEGMLEVREPNKCKIKCPACARVCPQMAIIFPKYKRGALSGGEGQDDGETAKVDVASLIGGDLYGALRKRGNQDRFSSERDKDRALAERQRCACMAGLGEQLDIPPEVLASISPAEVMKAHAAKVAANRAEEPPHCECDGAGTGDGDGDEADRRARPSPADRSPPKCACKRKDRCD